MAFYTRTTVVGPDGRVRSRKRPKVRRRKTEVRPGGTAGPYRSESSVPSIRKKAPKAERRRISKQDTKTGRRVRRLERSDRRRERQTAAVSPSVEETLEKARREAAAVARRKVRVAKAEQRALKTLRRAASTVPPDPQTAIVRARRAGVGLTAEQEKAFRLFHGKDATRKVKEARHDYVRRHEGIREVDDLTVAITSVAPGGGAAFQFGKAVATKGAATVAKQVGGAAAKKVEATAAKTASRTLNAGSGVRAGARLAGKGARKAARRAPKKGAAEAAAKAQVRRTARRQGARHAGARSRSASAAVPGLKLGKVSGVQMLPVVRGHEQAVIENPKKVAKTTARAIPGMVTAPVGAAIGGAMTVGRAGSAAANAAGVPGFRPYSAEEITAPVSGEIKAQLDFARQVAKVVTADDPDYVQREVEENLGALLPVMLGLGSVPLGRKIGKGRVTEAVRKIAERTRKNPHGDFRGETPRVFERAGQHKSEGERAARHRGRIRREVSDRAKGIRRSGGKAAGEEVVRRGAVQSKGRVRRGRREDLKIHTGDLVGYLVRKSMPLNRPDETLRRVRAAGKRLKPLPEGVKTPADKLNTRDVIAYIERNPEVLRDPELHRAVAEYKGQAKHARENAEELSPEHSERSRFLSVAIDEGIPFPEERFPRQVEGIVRAHPTRGRQAKEVLRKEARRDRSRSRALKRKAATAEKKAAIMRRELETREKLNKTHLDVPLADWQVKELKAIKEMERRGVVPRGSTPPGGHLQVITPRKGRTTGKTLPKHHDRLRERIDKLDLRAFELRDQAARAAEMAKAKHEASKGFDPDLEREFVDHVKGTLRRQGRPEPEYVATGRAREAPTYGATGAKLTQFPGKSKFRKGTAEEYGLVEEGLEPLLRESIARPVSRRESYKAMRGFLDDNEFRAGKKDEWTSDEARELFDEGVIDRENYVLIPRQLYKRSFNPEEWAANLKLALDEDPEAAMKSGRRFKIVRRHAADEFFSQMSNALVSPKLARANQATSYLILATSPAWAAMQVLAEGAQAAIAQPKVLNPRFVQKALRAYEEMPSHKRQQFDAWVGVTNRTIDRAEDLKLDLAAGDHDAVAGVYSTMEKTPYGRLLKAIPTSLRRIDQWKGGKIRALATIAKIDKDLNSRTNHFLRGVGGVHREMGRALKELEGKPLAEQLSFVADHPKWARKYQSYLDDVMGNWNALTKNERVAAQAMIFYPFLRMSLRWTFYAFPKRHPIKAAMLYYLGQQNATELKKFLGGDPSFFTQWAQHPVDVGNGEKKIVDLSRIAPGSNALLEAAGGSLEGPKGVVAARVAQPVLAAMGTAIYGVSPLSGKQEKNSGWNALGQLLSLSPLTRAADEATVPDGRKRAEGSGKVPVIGSTERKAAVDKLLDELRGAGSAARYARTLIAPPLPKDGGKERDLVQLGKIFDALSKNSSTARKAMAVEYADRVKNARLEGKGKTASKLLREGAERRDGMEATYDEADALLDKMLEKYGIPYKKEDNLFLDAYGQLYYGTEPKRPASIGGTTIGGAPIGASTASGRTSIGGAPVGRTRTRIRRSSEGGSVTTIGGVPIR